MMPQRQVGILVAIIVGIEGIDRGIFCRRE